MFEAYRLTDRVCLSVLALKRVLLVLIMPIDIVASFSSGSVLRDVSSWHVSCLSVY